MRLNIVIAEQEDKDYGGGAPRCQSVTSENEPSISYWVSNLNDCPEDAIIPRDLFSAEDYIKALELGMELRDKGYTEISVTYKELEG